MTCRICLENDGTSIRGVCDCSGSMAFVHRHCITRWMIESGKKQCEICNTDYRIKVDSYKQDDCFISIFCTILTVLSMITINALIFLVPDSILFIPAVIYIYHMMGAMFIYRVKKYDPLVVFTMLQIVCGCCFIAICLLLVSSEVNAINGIYIQCGLFAFIPVVGVIFRIITRV